VNRVILVKPEPLVNVALQEIKVIVVILVHKATLVMLARLELPVEMVLMAFLVLKERKVNQLVFHQ
jgi:hypothetical protein